MSSTLSSQAEVLRIAPTDFASQVSVAACHIECEGRFLYLKRSADRYFGHTWGVAGGKMEKGEEPHDGVLREVYEETGLRLDPQNLDYLAPLHIRSAGFDYTYHMFHYRTSEQPAVELNDEHCAHRWLDLEELDSLPIIPAGYEVAQHFRLLSDRIQIPRRPFYYMRHGQTEANVDPSLRRVDYDGPLNSTGRAQALALRQVVADLNIERLCVSPLLRARETASLSCEGLHLPVELTKDLGECPATVWHPLSAFQHGQGYQASEAVSHFLQRVKKGLEDALQAPSTPLIVAHGGVYLGISYLLGLTGYPWRIENCGLVRIDPVGKDAWRAQSLHSVHDESR